MTDDKKLEELEKALTDDVQITSRITRLAGKHNKLFALSLSVDFVQLLAIAGILAYLIFK